MSPLGNEDARAQVGTNGGLSQRWRELAKVSSEQDGDDDDDYEYFEGCNDTRNCDAEELEAAKLRIEEVVKALHHEEECASKPGNGYRPCDCLQADMLKIIREIL